MYVLFNQLISFHLILERGVTVDDSSDCDDHDDNVATKLGNY